MYPNYIPISPCCCNSKSTFIGENPRFSPLQARNKPRHFTSSKDSIEPSSPAHRAHL